MIAAHDLIGAVTERSRRRATSPTAAPSPSPTSTSPTCTWFGHRHPDRVRLGTLTAVKSSDTTGTGTGGQLTWTYTVADTAVAFLAAGQTKVETFTITLDDQHGGLITEQIAVTITGTNDAPVITAQDLIGAVTELITPSGNLTDSGTIAFTDVDLTDVHLVSATGTPIGAISARSRRSRQRHDRHRRRRRADLDLHRGG